MRTRFLKTGFFMILCAVIGCLPRLQAQPASAALPDDVGTVLKNSCSECHKGKYPPRNLNLEPEQAIQGLVGVASEGVPSFKRIDPIEPGNSYLLKKVRGDSGIAGKRMPPPGKTPLTAEQIQLLENWVKSFKAQGAFPEPPPSPGEQSEGGPSQASQAAAPAPKPLFSKPPFWGMRLVNLPTTMTMDKGDFLFRVSHRFVPAISDGYDAFWGFDGPAMIFLSLGYGITDNMGLTIGRSRLFQEMDIAFNWLFLEQGKNTDLPFSASMNTGLGWVTQKYEDRGLFDGKNIRLNMQVSLSHQVNKNLSFLIVPAFSTNTNHWEESSEGTLSVGVGGRLMFLDDMSLIGEWIPVIAGYKDQSNGWGFGVEKKIGGHVFQVFVANSTGLTPAQYITGGDYLLSKGDFRIGFNIFRTF